jgi:NADPH:quinone reductase-like Zn-dependent oxidoreductase
VSGSGHRRVAIRRFGDVNVLAVETAPSAPMGPGEARLRVAACGVNFADLMMRMGLYPEAPRPPFVPGYEVAGTVLEAGEEARRRHPWLVPGARVMSGTRFGGYSEEVVVPADRMAPLPVGWTFAEGAAFLVVHLTAWMALAAMARVREGDRVLVHGIAGGVGLAALGIARAAGARVVGTCGGAAKAARVRDLGAERAIDYTTEDVEAAVRDWAPDGVDVLLEPRGLKQGRRGLRLLAPAGRIVLYGVSGMVRSRRRRLVWTLTEGLAMMWLNPLTLIRRNQGVFGLNVLELEARPALLRRGLDDLLAGVERGRYRSVLDRTFPLEEAGLAHRHLHERRNVGKVVLTTGLEPEAAEGRP